MSVRRKSTKRHSTVPLLGTYMRASAAEPVLSQQAFDTHEAGSRDESMSSLHPSRRGSVSTPSEIIASSSDNDQAAKGKAVARMGRIAAFVEPSTLDSSDVEPIPQVPGASNDAIQQLERIAGMSLATPNEPMSSVESGTAQSTAAAGVAVGEGSGFAESNATMFASALFPPDLEEASALFADAPPDPEVMAVKDVVDMIPQMYRILDLVNDTDSSGLALVDKIIIAQESLGRFVNAVSPGAYQNMTRVDFAVLDRFSIKPLGVYGSKSEIVKFLLEKQLLDDEVAHYLQEGKDDMPDSKRLRPGLYLLRNIAEDITYVIFWPQDTTWDDNASDIVQRSRVTFMRYLTQVADQIIVLISDEHAESLTLANQSSKDEGDEEEALNDRMFAFEVAKTREEEENITVSPGFKVPVAFDDWQMTSGPQLISGDSCMGIVTTTYEPAQPVVTEGYRSFQSLRLGEFLNKASYKLDPAISEEAFSILMDHGLGLRTKDAVEELQKNREDQIKQARDRESITLHNWTADTREFHQAMVQLICTRISGTVAKTFSIFSPDELCQQDSTISDQTLQSASERLTTFARAVPDYEKWLADECSDQQLMSIRTREFMVIREGLQAQDSSLARDATVHDSHATSNRKSLISRSWNAVTNYILLGSSSEHSRERKGVLLGDPEYLAAVAQLIDSPALSQQVRQDIHALIAAARQHLSVTILSSARKLANRIDQVSLQMLSADLRSQSQYTLREIQNVSRANFIRNTQDMTMQRREHYFLIHGVESVGHPNRSGSTKYLMHVRECRLSDESLKHVVRVLSLTQEEEHELQLNPHQIPSPTLPMAWTSIFHLPVYMHILHMQLLQDRRCLLIIRNPLESAIFVYLEDLSSLNNAIANGRCKKKLDADKIGTSEPLASFNENKGQLCFCAPDKFLLHLFAFDEDNRLYGLHSSMDLCRWYEPGSLLSHVLFLSGMTEELVIVDECRARIFSLVTQQFRPATISLPARPTWLRSSPDGSCLLVGEPQPTGLIMHAYHIASFGSSAGFHLEFPGFSVTSLAVTSFVEKTRCHLVNLDAVNGSLESASLHISHKNTEFMFQTRARDPKSKKATSTANIVSRNCFVDCHRDVWTRFPVVSAVRRQVVISAQRRVRSITFVSRLPSSLYSRHFSGLIFTFETTQKKPVGEELNGIEIAGMTFDTAARHSFGNSTTVFQCGEWLVNILCLIPIQIAVTRKNGFYPLQDGLWSRDSENSMLGATVEEVIDSISFGWCESVFESYMSEKPVRVISSMGEQSVGKSFALNHLVDTSFAMSAMRTTDGVWMSVVPTEDALIVALDFEGVHSLERSIQEDSLMILFNTAISNLVLFRNNFALSRDISRLFQSFQSSTQILDPTINPTLFKSALCIVIKDVMDEDTEEIRKEFALKFRQMVDAEQGSNFITRLHGGSVMIIPWPVIQSRKFYTLFSRIKKVLDEQPLTHPRAGIFLQTIKTLMAKLRTNDWGSLDQNMALHRAHILQNMLPIALEYGATELDPIYEPLKDIDTGRPLDDFGLPPQLHLRPPGSSSNLTDQEMLREFVDSRWAAYHVRASAQEDEWVDALDLQLLGVAQRRIDQVQHWLDVNTSRFKTDQATFQDVRRQFEAQAISLKVGVQLCKLQCARCQLLCLNFRHHDGPHDCHTDHKCPKPCNYLEEHQSTNDIATSCGLPGGHSGEHICDIARHLCGKQCRLSGKVGCLERCGKRFGHPDEEHACPASEHECGMPCMLSHVRTSNGNMYTCQEVCRMPSETPHDKHVCRSQSCPLPCQLCQRLCAVADHLHALNPHAIHLCGQSHVCSALCQMPGTCRIDLKPQSVETTFTGRHDTFLYTKYSQASRRLRCIIPIPPEQTDHRGPHKHTLDDSEIHHCETRCENCGYFCTLPFGHPQQEHETSHGSMSRTRWAVDGDDDTVIEVNGRRFGSGDDGAPLLCSMVCQELGRHLHVDYCRTPADERCQQPDLEHIHTAITPDPEVPKDWVTHELYWRRRGFKDPYSREQRNEFAKCTAECPDPNHNDNGEGQPEPSKCTLSVLHAPLDPAQGPPGGQGYVSSDGHHFVCRNPAVYFHVLFVIDRSSSMSHQDHRPLPGTPVTRRLQQGHDNRLGAVLSSLHAFWSARNAVLEGYGPRRDAYSMILFDARIRTVLENDTSSTPDELVDHALPHTTGWGTNFTQALTAARDLIERNWDADRSPVLILLSDGEGRVDEDTVRDLCRRTASLGKPLSLHTVAFGPSSRRLQLMTDIAAEVARETVIETGVSIVEPSFNEANNTVRLAETFLGIAGSLTKPRGALISIRANEA